MLLLARTSPLIYGCAIVALALGPSTAVAQVPSSRPCGPVVASSCSAGADQPHEWAEEQRLCALATDSTETYRFTWLRTFHHPVVVRVERSGRTSTLTAKELDGMGGYDPGRLVIDRTVLLNLVQWRRLAGLADSTGLWSRPTDERPLSLTGSDGATWLIEGVRNGQYHSMTCWSPAIGHRSHRGQVSPLGRWGLYMLTLADLLPADSDEVY